MGEKLKKLPMGIDSFAGLRTAGYYYVDKTGMIRELLEDSCKVNLFTRPRRFGKSLNVDMLKTFFEIGTEPELFEGLTIWTCEDICDEYFAKYPVISLTLKDVEGEDHEMAYQALCSSVGIEVRRLCVKYGLLDSDLLLDTDKIFLKEVLAERYERGIAVCLRRLFELLAQVCGRQVILFVDEYDVPLDKARQNGYYDQMLGTIRNFLSTVLKSNSSLEFAVLTGCLRIAKESIFTGLNHFKIRTISDIDCAEYFGFTDDEVRKMLEYYGVEERISDIKEWYDGYRFGTTDVYCPWDVINQCDKFRADKNARMESHWENSSNAIIQNIIEDATEATKAEIEALISGECVEKELVPELTYTDLDSRDIDVRQTYLWSVLFATGYLTDAGAPEGERHKLVIPNREVLGIYEKKIRSWFRVKVTSDGENWKRFCNAVRQGDGAELETVFDQFMKESISIRDTCTKKEMKENFYHGMLLGLLKAEGNFIVKSNAESGIGYTDIMVVVPG